MKIIAVALLLGVGCGGAQVFEPTEHATARSPAGYSAAEYDIWGRAGNVGEAKVWSRGAYEADVNGRPATVIEVSFQVDNVASTPMTLANVRLDAANIGGRPVHDLAPVRIEGGPVIPPGTEATMRAYFAVSPPVDPEDVQDFRVRWQLRGGDEMVYSQRTPFVQERDSYVYDPYFSDPYVYDPFGRDPFLSGRHFPREIGV